MTTRAHIAGRVRQVRALVDRCDSVPPVVTDTWPDLSAEVGRALAQGDESRARELADQWADECLDALVGHLLNAPLLTGGRAADG